MVTVSKKTEEKIINFSLDEKKEMDSIIDAFRKKYDEEDDGGGNALSQGQAVGGNDKSSNLTNKVTAQNKATGASK